MTLEIQVLAWDMHKKVAVAKLVHQISTPPQVSFRFTTESSFDCQLLNGHHVLLLTIP
jgi:hypothetical protein